MTGAQWYRIAQGKMFSQRRTCGAEACQHKEDKLDLYKYPRPELAHIVPDTKVNRKKYGTAALDHQLNRVLVHEGQYGGVDCNDSVMLGAGHPVEAEALMAKIKEAMDAGD